MSDILRQRQSFMEAMGRRSDVQLLAAFVQVLWVDKGLSNEDCLQIAQTLLLSMAATDDVEQGKLDDEAERELRIARLMQKVCEVKQ